jgi:hypothetical protein
MVDDDVRAGEELAKAWLRGEGELIDDLPALVDGMDKPLDATARAFLVTVGNAAKAMAKREDLPTPAGAPAPRAKGPAKAQPTPEEPAEPKVDIDQFRRRKRDHELAARLERLASSNASAWGEQAAMVRRMGWRDE